MSFSFDPDDGLVVVNAELKGPSGTAIIRLALDTGATSTLINTALLLSSSVTLTFAHHALLAGHRNILKVFLAATFLLGFIFVYLQGAEYIEAYEHMNLKLTSGIYGSTFFMLTGFHGMHVTLGAIMLLIIWLRVVKGHFTPDNHFAFEAVAWYWHFVDVVWIGLYVFVYWM